MLMLYLNFEAIDEMQNILKNMKNLLFYNVWLVNNKRFQFIKPPSR